MAGIAQSLFLNSLETVINRALLLDPVTEHKVKQLSGQRLTVRAHTPEIVATVIFAEDSIQIFGDPDELINGDYTNIKSSADASTVDATLSNTTVINTTIEAPSFTFAAQALRDEHQGIDTDIKISGDRELVEKVHHIVSTLDVDWEEPLSQFIGDAAAHKVGQIGRDFFRWTKRAMRTFITDVDVFVREEADIVPPNEAMKFHIAAVDQVHSDVDYLQQRIDKLKQKMQNKDTHID
jgi:ubiquinone biosynthesis protein UbiJ